MSQLFATKSLTQLLEEMKGEDRLRRVLGPVQLTSLGVGAVIGAPGAKKFIERAALAPDRVALLFVAGARFT